ncbi:MAG: MBL fold metallo-hydrolase [Treponema sp.]|jgi:phosphoribosyl 1,2-cyclic phosphodiesterase|nr:MBL fold metallo-hydrolase [Treponema sp.]
MLSVRFWGVRGSITCPGPDTVYYGGNTSCLEIRAGERLIIVDMGTGLRPLGDWLMANDFKKYGHIEADIFVTHTHWDHVSGLPLFTPVFIPGTKLRITGPVSFEEVSFQSIIETQFLYRYWPVHHDELAAKIEYGQINETTLDLGEGLKVVSKFLNHPVACLGYRFEYQGKSIVIVFDHEPYRNLFPADSSQSNYDEEASEEGELAAAEENEKIISFMRNADIVIHDSQYTEDEYQQRRKGWGHASYDHAINAAIKANVKKLFLFHHDPSRTDEQLKQFEQAFREKFKIDVYIAREGNLFSV